MNISIRQNNDLFNKNALSYEHFFFKFVGFFNLVLTFFRYKFDRLCSLANIEAKTANANSVVFKNFPEKNID